MCSDKSPPIGSIHRNSKNSKPDSAEKKITKLTLFEDLVPSSDTENMTTYEDVSDCESGVSGAENEPQFQLGDGGLIRISDEEMIHGIIKNKLVSSLTSYGFDARVDSICRNDCAGIMSRAKLQSFCIYSRAMEMKYGQNANVKYAWYGASKNEIHGIVSHGFSLPMNTSTYGQGIYLSPVDHPLESMQLAAPDEDGLRHLLLCRVLLGKMENICLGSEQYNPSSEEFDSGVDDLASPRKYIIWSSRMNTHILPEFVVSFRASSHSRGHQRNSQPSRLPNSDWMPFPTLITALSRFLPPDAIESIRKHHDDYRKQKVTRHELINRVRHIAGDKLLMAIIRSHRGKFKASQSSLHR